MRLAACMACALFGLTLARDGFAAEDMAQAMQMNDAASFGKVWLDQLEWRAATDAEGAWQGGAWYGSDYNKVWLRSEGSAAAGRVENARAEILWDHVVARWWSVNAGAREDFGAGPTRTWAAVGVRGLAPQGIDVEATLYAGDASRSAARLKMQYELLLTQRLVLQPEIELNLYGKADPQRDTAAGLSDIEVGLRMRYEVRREIAPYAGLMWVRRRGAAMAPATQVAGDLNELRLCIGVRLWL